MVSGGVYVVDHKFTSWSIGSLTNSLSTSDQTTSYLLQTQEGVFEGGAKPEAMIYNIIRSARGAHPEFKRPVFHRTQSDLDEFAYAVDSRFSLITRKAMEPTTNLWDWTKNSKACYRFNKPCPFLPLCKGDNYKTLLGVLYQQREDDDDGTDSDD
jgi:hypothetical protein